MPKRKSSKSRVWATGRKEETQYVGVKSAWVPPVRVRERSSCNSSGSAGDDTVGIRYCLVRKFIKRVFLPVVLLLYTLFGGVVFHKIEGQHEAHELSHKRQRLLESATSLCEIAQGNEHCIENMTRGLHKLEHQLVYFVHYGFKNHTSYKHWTYMGAVFFSSTVYTAIGYGNQVPRTMLGKYVTMAYATIGIPFMLNVMTELAGLMMDLFTIVYAYIVHALLRVVGKRRKLELEHYDTVADFHRCCEMPLWFGCMIGYGYLFVGAGFFLLIEHQWSYFDAFYFCFQTLSTIGFGDITPQSDYYVLFSFVYIIVGLAFISMCTKVMQRGMTKMKELCLCTKGSDGYASAEDSFDNSRRSSSVY